MHGELGLDRFHLPVLEGNCGWAPWFLARLDEHWEWVGRYETEEDTVKDYVAWLGDDSLVFSTDYPHAIELALHRHCASDLPDRDGIGGTTPNRSETSSR